MNVVIVGTLFYESRMFLFERWRFLSFPVILDAVFNTISCSIYASLSEEISLQFSFVLYCNEKIPIFVANFNLPVSNLCS